MCKLEGTSVKKDMRVLIQKKIYEKRSVSVLL